ncbi:MAG TPA: cyclase family protein [Phycisphaerae bacterium]|nr:cyclase family protein [Phycisphaerae bacterium]HRY68600.1 cyclase family protein [Phycisphaerae bacterium]HSA25649.1 cyclase family protein [Phycisphaerae bacterium]
MRVSLNEPGDCMGNWIDITRTLKPGIVHWPGDLAFELRRVATLTGPSTANLSEIHTNVHAGTHVDAPLHYIDGGMDVASLPLERLCGPATVVDVAQEGDVTAEDIHRASIPPGDRVLLRTTSGRLWSKSTFDQQFFALTADAACLLVEIGTPLVGVDYLSVDRFDAGDAPVHRILLGAGVIILEGLDLDTAPAGRYELIALPMKIAGADGSPIRAMIRTK